MLVSPVETLASVETSVSLYDDSLFSATPFQMDETSALEDARLYNTGKISYAITATDTYLSVQKTKGVPIDLSDSTLKDGGMISINGDSLQTKPDDWKVLRDFLSESSGRSDIKLLLNNKTTKIPAKALANASALSMISAYCVRSIGDSAFQGCCNLTDMILPDKAPTLGRNAFDRHEGPTLYTLTSPCERHSGYNLHAGWPSRLWVNGIALENFAALEQTSEAAFFLPSDAVTVLADEYMEKADKAFNKKIQTIFLTSLLSYKHKVEKVQSILKIVVIAARHSVFRKNEYFLEQERRGMLKNKVAIGKLSYNYSGDTPFSVSPDPIEKVERCSYHENFHWRKL